MNRILNSIHPYLGAIWLVLVLGCAAFNYWGLVQHQRVSFDILSMLPTSHSDSLEAIKHLTDDTNVVQKNVILFGHKDPKISKGALIKFRHRVLSQKLPLQEQGTTGLLASYHTLFKSLYPFRAGLLAEEDRDQLNADQSEQLTKAAVIELLNPFNTSNIKEDPFSLFSHFVKANQLDSSFQMDTDGDVFVQSAAITWYVYTAIVTAPAYALNVHDIISHELYPLLATIQHEDNVKILKTGVAFYAAAGSAQARQEISSIGLFSTIGIILIILMVFKSIRPLLFALCIIVSAITVGLAICLVVFGSVHILALVIGCSLVGIVVDYTLHYTCSSYCLKTTDKKHIVDRLVIFKTLMPALPLSVLSSVVGYGLMLFMPFPGIRQLAILSSVGLIVAFISVYLWGPYIITQKPAPISCLRQTIQEYLEKLAHLGSKKIIRRFLSIVLLAIFCIGFCRLSIDDNVRSFQALDAQLKGEEDDIKSIIDMEETTRFLSITRDSLEEVLQVEEAIIAQLKDLNIGYRGISGLIPSKKRQEENRQLLQHKLYTQSLQKFEPLLGQNITLDIKSMGLESPILDHIPAPLPSGLDNLIHISKQGQITGRLFITTIADATPLYKLANSFENVLYINVATEYSNLFADCRLAVSMLVLIVLASIIVFLSLKSGIKTATRIVAPIALSLVTTIGLLGIIMPFNLFHIVGLLIILCVGIDYALFLSWRSHQHSKGDLLLLGNALAATTTILSFGLLMFSKTTAVYSFGLSVFIGIFVCFIVTTFFLGKSERDYE